MIGKVLDDRYRVLSLLGEGGMGKVYLAEHVLLEKRMAVKVLHEEYSRQEEVVKRFQQEAIAASRIGQENIVSVTDFGRTAEGALFFVMEELEGESLAAILRREGALPTERWLPILAQMCRALGAAHSRGIVHRDLKPENVVLLQREERADFVKVLDFGISKVGSAEPGKDRLTRVGMIMGTPEYMAPEQAAGTTVDHRVDIYSMGVMAYELCTGGLPFQAQNPLQLLIKHQTEMPQPPTQRRPDLGIPPDVEAFILKCLEKKPEDRFQKMSEVAQALSQLLEARGVRTYALSPSQGTPSMRGLMATPPPPGTPSSPSVGTPRTPTGTLALDSPVGLPRSPSATPKGGTLQLNAQELTATPAPIPLTQAVETAAPRRDTLLGEEELALVRPKRGKLFAAGVGLLLAAGVGVFLLTGQGSREPSPPPGPAVAAVEAAALPQPVVPAPPVSDARPPEPQPSETPPAIEPAPKPTLTAPPAKRPESRKHRVALRSNPSGAVVFTGRERVGVTPLELELKAGTESLYRFTLSGYRPALRKVSSADRVVQVDLVKQQESRRRRRTGLKDDPYADDELKDDPFQ